MVACTIDGTIIFQRSDPRVSKETLQCKVYLSLTKQEFAVEHHLRMLSSLEHQRIRFPFNHMMGMLISGKSLIFDIRYPPQNEVKTKITLQDNRTVFPSKWKANDNIRFSTDLSKYRTVLCGPEAVNTTHIVEKISEVPVLPRHVRSRLPGGKVISISLHFH